MHHGICENGESGLNPGGYLYFRLDINLVKGLSKHTLNTYFSGMKIDPKDMFLHAFLLICPSCPFQNLSLWRKTYPLFPILHIFAPRNNVGVHIAYSWKTSLITWFFFLRGWYPTLNTSALTPPRLDFSPCIPMAAAIWMVTHVGKFMCLWNTLAKMKEQCMSWYPRGGLLNDPYRHNNNNNNNVFL